MSHEIGNNLHDLLYACLRVRFCTGVSFALFNMPFIFVSFTLFHYVYTFIKSYTSTEFVHVASMQQTAQKFRTQITVFQYFTSVVNNSAQCWVLRCETCIWQLFFFLFYLHAWVESSVDFSLDVNHLSNTKKKRKKKERSYLYHHLWFVKWRITCQTFLNTLHLSIFG